jgi:hypothetical protein
LAAGYDHYDSRLKLNAKLDKSKGRKHLAFYVEIAVGLASAQFNVFKTEEAEYSKLLRTEKIIGAGHSHILELNCSKTRTQKKNYGVQCSDAV